MTTALTPEIEEFLRRPNVAALATVRPDGRPHVTPVWYDFSDNEFMVSTFRSAQKLENVARKGFAALCVYTQELPYRLVIVQGTARVGSPVDSVWRERIARRYLGDSAGRQYVRDTADWDVIAIHIRPVKWTTEGFSAG